MPTIHEYPIDVTWNGGLTGGGSFVAEHSGTKTSIAVPPEFNGAGGATNPEELLTGAIASCYSMTFGIIATNRKLPVTSLNVHAVGQVEQSGAMTVYKSITVTPRIGVAADTTEEQLKVIEDMAHKADGYCLITNAVRGKVEIAVVPTIVKE